MMNIYQDVKRRGMYLALGSDPEGIVVFSIYQNNVIKTHFIFKEIIKCKPFFLFLACALPVILTSALKSTNSLGYRELRESIRACKNGHWLLW